MTGSDPPPSSRALAPRPSDRPAAVDDARFQSLWLATQERPWRSIALIGASKGVPTMETANMLAQIAWWYSGEPTSVFDLRDLSLRLVDYQTRDIAMQVEAGDRVFVALRSTFENPTSAAVARAVDAVVLCIELGRTDAKSASATIEAVGRDRVLGSILVEPATATGKPTNGAGKGP